MLNLLTQIGLWIAGKGGGTSASDPFVQSVDFEYAVPIDGSVQIQAGSPDTTLFGGVVPAHAYMLQNNTSAAVWFNDTGNPAAATGPSFQLLPNGGSFITPRGYVPTGAVHIFGGTPGQWVTARYW